MIQEYAALETLLSLPQLREFTYFQVVFQFQHEAFFAGFAMHGVLCGKKALTAKRAKAREESQSETETQPT